LQLSASEPESGLEPLTLRLQGECSTSKGVAICAGARRRRETASQRRERRVRPYCRRMGQRGVGPIVDGSPFFTQRDSDHLEPFPPSGERAVGGQAPAHEASAVAGGVDAIWRACPPSHQAALSELRETAAGGGGVPALLSSARSFPVVAVALAAWELVLPARPPRFSRAAAEQLQRSACQLDRWWGPGAAADWIAHRIADVDADQAQGEDPQSVRFYSLQLRQVARKARRVATGRPGPRPFRSRRPGASW